MADLPISEFLKTRLTEYDSKFELRKGTGFEQLFFKPMEFIVQPLREEADQMFTGQSLLRILNSEDPDSFSEDTVDAIISNIFVTRREGGKSSGVARLLYNDPGDYEYPSTGLVCLSSGGLRYTNPAPYSITRAQMNLQNEDGLYYYDTPMESEDTGADTELDVNDLVTVLDDDLVIRVSNSGKFQGGLDRETNTEFITRARNSIGTRDPVVGKGFNAVLFENFKDFLVEAQPVGFGDDEMMRDIVYNTHIGGRVDGYLKTSVITQGQSDFFGLTIDPSRQTYSSKNCQLIGTSWYSLGNTDIDRSYGKIPYVQEIKDSIRAEFISTVDISNPVDLSVNQYVTIGIDGVIKTVRLAGATPALTTRNEITNLINYVFGINIAFISGNTIKLISPTDGLLSQVYLTIPNLPMTSALTSIFGLPHDTTPYIYQGDGPVVFIEGSDYEINDLDGNIRRVVGATIVNSGVSGDTTSGSKAFSDSTPGIFNSVTGRDVLTITSGLDIGDHRIVSVSGSELTLEIALTDTANGITYSINRTGIKNNETVYASYYFNPVSIDIGNLVKLDAYGRVRGVRPGRELCTIGDLPILRINYIEEIDPLTKESTGYILDGKSGFGQGGFGKGGFGQGQGREWSLVVNSPAERFSMFEDSYIIFLSGFQGLSIRVHYDYVPEIALIHEFIRLPNQRILDGDILMKHFLPAYVSGTIRYKIDSSNSRAPTNEEVTASVKAKINQTPSSTELEYSDIIQTITRALDPYDSFGTYFESFKLVAEIHNTDGTLTRITGDNKLTVPTLDPFPISTPRPLSPKIVHWIFDDVVLERM